MAPKKSGKKGGKKTYLPKNEVDIEHPSVEESPECAVQAPPSAPAELKLAYLGPTRTSTQDEEDKTPQNSPVEPQGLPAIISEDVPEQAREELLREIAEEEVEQPRQNDCPIELKSEIQATDETQESEVPTAESTTDSTHDAPAESQTGTIESSSNPTEPLTVVLESEKEDVRDLPTPTATSPKDVDKAAALEEATKEAVTDTPAKSETQRTAEALETKLTEDAQQTPTSTPPRSNGLFAPPAPLQYPAPPSLPAAFFHQVVHPSESGPATPSSSTFGPIFGLPHTPVNYPDMMSPPRAPTAGAPVTPASHFVPQFATTPVRAPEVSQPQPIKIASPLSHSTGAAVIEERTPLAAIDKPTRTQHFGGPIQSSTSTSFAIAAANAIAAAAPYPTHHTGHPVHPHHHHHHNSNQAEYPQGLEQRFSEVEEAHGQTPQPPVAPVRTEGAPIWQSNGLEFGNPFQLPNTQFAIPQYQAAPTIASPFEASRYGAPLYSNTWANPTAVSAPSPAPAPQFSYPWQTLGSHISYPATSAYPTTAYPSSAPTISAPAAWGYQQSWGYGQPAAQPAWNGASMWGAAYPMSPRFW